MRHHLTGMIASGIVMHSAMVVVVANRVSPDLIHGRYSILVWLLPALVGLPAIFAIRLRGALLPRVDAAV